MTNPRLEYSGQIEDQDVLEGMRLNRQMPGRFDFIGWLVWPLPLGLGCFLPLQFLFPEVDGISFASGCLAAVIATAVLSHFVNQLGTKLQINNLSHNTNIGPALVVIEDRALLYKVRTRTTALYFSAIKNISIETRVVMIWIGGDLGYMVPRSFFSSRDEEAAFVTEMKRRIAATTPAIDAAILAL